MNATVLAALQRLQWSEVIDRKQQITRCPVCQKLEREGQHADDCYIGQALASVKAGEPIVFLAADNGGKPSPAAVSGKAIIGAVASSTLPPASLICERKVYLQLNGRTAHVWTHWKDRSTTFTPQGRKLIEILETIDFSPVVEEQEIEFYKYTGSSETKYLYFAVDGSRVLAYGHDLTPSETPLTPGDIKLCQAEGKMQRIERPAELAKAA